MEPEKLVESLQETLRHEIPLTAPLGLEVRHLDEAGTLTLTAPLEPNINHKCTAFGGSLYSLAVLTGWGWIWCALRSRELPGTIVVQHSRMEYLEPVDGELRARTSGPDPARVQRFLHTYERRGRARLDVPVLVDGQGPQAAARFEGSYVVLREPPPRGRGGHREEA